MEPVYIDSISLDSDDEEDIQHGGTTSIEEKDNHILLDGIEELRIEIFTFKKHLFEIIVNKDTTHSSETMGALMTFHALWLNSIAYWIGLLDTEPTSKPTFSNEMLTEYFEAITDAVNTIKLHSSKGTIHNGRILLYALLTKISTENHPYDLGPIVE